MHITPQSTNVTLATFNNGVQVLFSYKTPVACYIPNRGYFRSAQQFSVTTSRHINTWMGKGGNILPQNDIENIVGAL